MPNVLEEIRKDISKRLKELQPLVDEYASLEAAEQALSGVGPRGNGRRTVQSSSPKQRRTRSARAKNSGTGRRGRPRGSGTRAIQAFELVKARPGITIPELAETMGIKQNYLYRVMPGLAEEGKVVKSGRGWHAKEPAK
ncbi:MAG: hypothetical protein QOC68_4261 [Solirubrobacteraceae bacterium]|jgi:hypothetical protein|nr:hypothetical protein [Solirubrobacteraceae bacterium]